MTISVAMLAMLAAFQATPAPTVQDGTRVEDIVVNGRRLDDLVGEFVDEISQPARRRGLARWHDGVCVGVVNLPAAYAQSMIDRVSQVAQEVGLRPGDPGCRPGIVVIATDDGAALATSMVQRRNSSFRVGSTQTDAGSRALREFQTSDRPVRWWHTSLPVNSDTGEVAIRTAGMVGPDGQPASPTLNTFASRLNTPIRDDMRRVVVIVDVTKLGDTNFQQLSDYVALLALAQIDAEASTGGYDTILNMFDGSGQPEGLTDWDMGYLQSLYSTHPERIDPSVLTRSVASDVARGIRQRERLQGE